MQCYYVLIHGQLDWSTASPPTGDDETYRPKGSYCHRFVLASSTIDAQDAAFRRVRDNFDRQTGWLKANLVTLELEADEVSPAPIYRLLTPDNRGHIFYDQE